MPKAVQLCVDRLDSSLPLPEYAYPGDAGLDLRASQGCVLQPGQRVSIPTGIRVAIPEGYAGLVLPRSGLAAQKGLSLVNAPGLIDSQYRGELLVLAINLDQSESIEIKRGDRIAQLVISPVPSVEVFETTELDETERSNCGFGSSGTK